MKTKFKTIMKIMIALVILIIVSLILYAFPSVSNKLGEIISVPGQKIRQTCATVIATGIGLALVSFGVSALAVPLVGIALIVIGLAIAGWALYNSGWFGNSASTIPIDDKSRLQKIA